MVSEGRVQVNDATAAPTTPVIDGDKVMLDGKAITIEASPTPRLFMLNKPLDVLVSAKDPQGRKTVYELPALQAKGLPRLMYVGRLDVNSEGLLLMSSDGVLAQKIMNPSSALPRVYRVRVHGRLSERDMVRIRMGVVVDGIRYRGAEIAEEEDKGGRTNSWYRVTLYEGKNREIRKLMEHFDCVVNRLIRTQYGPFHLEKLEQGRLVEIAPRRVQSFIASLSKPQTMSMSE